MNNNRQQRKNVQDVTYSDLCTMLKNTTDRHKIVEGEIIREIEYLFNEYKKSLFIVNNWQMEKSSRVIIGIPEQVPYSIEKMKINQGSGDDLGIDFIIRTGISENPIQLPSVFFDASLRFILDDNYYVIYVNNKRFTVARDNPDPDKYINVCEFIKHQLIDKCRGY